MRRGAALIAFVYLALALAMVFTRAPWCDEGWFASPAKNLAEHGFMGTTVYDVPEAMCPRFERFTYWTSPLHFVVQAAVYRVFGFGLIPLRLISVAAGALLVLATFVIGRAVLAEKGLALLAAAFVGLDNLVTLGAADGRMDLLAAALGLAGIAVYLRLREERLGVATFTAHALVCASGLTHPNGILPLAVLLGFQLALDRKRLRARDALLAAIPYAIGGAAWGAYILEDPHAFSAQFRASLAGRLSGPGDFPRALVAEVRERWLATFGFSETALPWTRVRILVPLTYLAGALGAGAVGRREPNLRRLALATALELFLLAFLVGNKTSAYLVHPIPLLALTLAGTLGALWSAKRLRPLVLLAAAGLLVLQIGTSAGQIGRDRLHSTYEPAVAAIESELHPGELVVGSAELAFGLGFDRVRDDPRLGLEKGRDPAVLVLDDRYRARLEAEPALRSVLARFRLVARHGVYEIYRRER